MTQTLDFDLLAQGLSLAQELRRLGFQPKGYQLASPYDRHHQRALRKPLAPACERARAPWV